MMLDSTVGWMERGGSRNGWYNQRLVCEFKSVVDPWWRAMGSTWRKIGLSGGRGEIETREKGRLWQEERSGDSEGLYSYAKGPETGISVGG